MALQVDCHFSQYRKHFNMKRHVQFLGNTDQTDLYQKTSYLPLRLSRLNHVETDKTTSRFGHKRQRPTKEQNQGIKTISIPKTMTDAPFLQHPALTPGQKRFLYSIAEAYSKDHMRQLICQHYMNVLHRCIRTDLKPQVIKTHTPEVEHVTNSQTTTIFGIKEHGEKLLTTEKVKKTTFPKITSQQKVSSRFPKTVQARRKTTLPIHASLRDSKKWDVDFVRKLTEVDSYLSRRMSGLSFNESEEENEDFLFPA